MCLCVYSAYGYQHGMKEKTVSLNVFSRISKWLVHNQLLPPARSTQIVNKNVIYLHVITCKKCGIQYVGETSQRLRCRMNNHRNRLTTLTNLYLYHHFTSDGYSEDDITTEEITTSNWVSASAKWLEREHYWCRDSILMG